MSFAGSSSSAPPTFGSWIRFALLLLLLVWGDPKPIASLLGAFGLPVESWLNIAFSDVLGTTIAVLFCSMRFGTRHDTSFNSLKILAGVGLLALTGYLLASLMLIALVAPNADWKIVGIVSASKFLGSFIVVPVAAWLGFRISDRGKVARTARASRVEQ